MRIAPLCLVVAAVIILLQSPEIFARPDFFVRLGSFTFDGFHGPEGLGPFWSLSTEWQFYLAVPFVFVVLRRALQAGGKTRLLMIQIGCLAACTRLRLAVWQGSGATIIGWNPFVYTPLYCNLDVFLAGFLANWWLDVLSPRARDLLARMWPAFVIVLILVYSQITYAAMGAYTGRATLFRYRASGYHRGSDGADPAGRRHRQRDVTTRLWLPTALFGSGH